MKQCPLLLLLLRLHGDKRRTVGGLALGDAPLMMMMIKMMIDIVDDTDLTVITVQRVGEAPIPTRDLSRMIKKTEAIVATVATTVTINREVSQNLEMLVTMVIMVDGNLDAFPGEMNRELTSSSVNA